jgi:hypothetical protein
MRVGLLCRYSFIPRGFQLYYIKPIHHSQVVCPLYKGVHRDLVFMVTVLLRSCSSQRVTFMIKVARQLLPAVVISF